MGARARARGVEDGLGQSAAFKAVESSGIMLATIAATTNVVHEEAAGGRESVSIYNHWL